MDARAFYTSADWRAVSRSALERDNRRCTVARLLGGDCSERLQAHHIEPLRDRPDLACDLDNVATVCSRHHPQWESIRRQVRRKRGWRPCPHFHPTSTGRRECERRLNRELVTA